jgi:hypothetical protein
MGLFRIVDVHFRIEGLQSSILFSLVFHILFHPSNSLIYEGYCSFRVGGVGRIGRLSVIIDIRSCSHHCGFCARNNYRFPTYGTKLLYNFWFGDVSSFDSLSSRSAKL